MQAAAGASAYSPYEVTQAGIRFNRENISSKTLNQLNEFFEDNPNLEKINLAETKLKADEFVHLKYPKTLRKVQLSSTKINDEGLRHLYESCPSLEFLGLCQCQGITEKAHEILVPPRTLMEFDLRRLLLTEKGLLNYIKCLPESCLLHFYHSHFIPLILFKVYPENPSLWEKGIPEDPYLSMTTSHHDCTVSVSAIKAKIEEEAEYKRLGLGEPMVHWSEFDFSNSAITADQIITFLEKNPLARRVNFSNCRSVNDQVLQQIYARCIYLTFIGLSYCSEITLKAHTNLKPPKTLIEADLRDQKFDENALKNYIDCCPDLDTLYFNPNDWASCEVYFVKKGYSDKKYICSWLKTPGPLGIGPCYVVSIKKIKTWPAFLKK